MSQNHGQQRRVRTSRQWISYFQLNADRQPDIPWEAGRSLTPDQRAAVLPSLRAWQLGETSDGRHLLAAARDYSLRVNDPDFVDAVRLFICEEQRHGRNLGRFLDIEGVQRARSDWGDTLFRKFRYALPTMEVWATPVVMVETHAMIYYNALRRATDSPILRAVCRQILIDEVPHLEFQCQRLAILHRQRSKLLRTVTMALHRIIFLGITLAIWAGHRRALQAGGYSLGRFWRSAWGRMNAQWRAMNPQAYRWVDTSSHESPIDSAITSPGLEKSLPRHS